MAEYGVAVKGRIRHKRGEAGVEEFDFFAGGVQPVDRSAKPDEGSWIILNQGDQSVLERAEGSEDRRRSETAKGLNPAKSKRSK
jgi:hypothetical protein